MLSMIQCSIPSDDHMCYDGTIVPDQRHCHGIEEPATLDKNKVFDENVAQDITEKFMLKNMPRKFEHDSFCIGFSYWGYSTSPYTIRRNWEIVSKQVSITDDDNWEVYMEATYDKCGYGIDRNVCIQKNKIKGQFIIDKDTGQIIG
jgi:hypothetical protein